MSVLKEKEEEEEKKEEGDGAVDAVGDNDVVPVGDEEEELLVACDDVARSIMDLQMDSICTAGSSLLNRGECTTGDMTCGVVGRFLVGVWMFVLGKQTRGGWSWVDS